MADTADQELIAKWNTKFTACQQQRINFERQWHANLAFYFGRHWVTFNTRSDGSGYSLSETKPKDAWRVRLTTNKTKRIIRSELTKLTKEEAQFFIVPSTTEESDRSAALAGEAVADYLLHSRQFNATRRRATLWTVLCGTSYIKAYYDSYAEDLDGLPGKMCYEHVTPFHLFVPNLQAETIEEQPFVIHARTMDPDQLFSLYGQTLEPTTESATTILDSRFMTSIGIKNTKSNPLKQCFVKEVWLKPCKEFPQGAMFIFCNNRILNMNEAIPPVGDTALPTDSTQLVGQEPQDPKLNMPPISVEGYDLQSRIGAFPYEHKMFPFVKIDHIPAGRFYATSVLDDIIPIQKEYNRGRSLMVEIQNMTAKPQWAMVKGSFEMKQWSTKPGLVLQLNPGFNEPRALVPPPLAPVLKENLEYAVRDMDDISSQFEISKGRTPPGVEAASAIAYLQEENDTILHHTVSSIEEAVQTIGFQSLNLVHQYWDEERIVRVISKNNTFEARRFKAEDLKANLDFRVESGSMAPRSMAAKQAFITELMKMGVIPPDKALRYLQMNETNRLYEELKVDERHAERENAFMSEGVELKRAVGVSEPVPDPMTGVMSAPEPIFDTKQQVDLDGNPIIDVNTGQPAVINVTTNSFDNHEIHIYIHERYMKSQEYELLPIERKTLFLNHLQQHKQEVLAEQRTMAVQDMISQTQGQPMQEEAPANV